MPEITVDPPTQMAVFAAFTDGAAMILVNGDVDEQPLFVITTA